MINNNDIAKAFSNGETKGKGNNMFIDGDTIYSYGYHFPICRRVTINNNIFYLFNADGYSNTTAKHKSHVRSVLLKDNIILIKNLGTFQSNNMVDILNMIALNNLDIENLKLKFKRSKKHKDMYKRDIDDIYIQNGLLAKMGLCLVKDNNILKSRITDLKKIEKYSDKIRVVQAMSIQ